MINCPNCQYELEDGVGFCYKCGYKIEAPVQTPVTPEQPVQQPYVAPEQPVQQPYVAPEQPVQQPYGAPQQPYVAPQQYQQPYQQQPYTAYQQPQQGWGMPTEPVAETKKKANVCGIIALILSIISVFCSLISFINLIFLIPAAILLIVGFVKSKNTKKGVLIATSILLCIAIILTIVFSVLIFNSDSSSSGSSYTYTNKLESAYTIYCSSSYADLAYDESYLLIDTNPYNIDDYHDSDAWSAIQSVNTYLGFSYSLQELMTSTRALDGRQTQSNGSYTVSWTYHPDQGLEVMYTKN